MLAQRKVLVLNKSWNAIKVVTLESALKKLTGTYEDGTPKAKIIDCVHDFMAMEWSDWTNYCTSCQIVRKGDEVSHDHTCTVCNTKLGMQPQEGEDGMRSVKATFRIPTVIQYTKYNKLPQQKIHYNRRTIYRRDECTCQYCGKRKPMGELSLDHVIPRCQGGQTNWENIVVACTECNAHKAGRTPKEANMTLLRLPKKPNYNFFPGDIRVKDWEHFIGTAYWNTELEHDDLERNEEPVKPEKTGKKSKKDKKKARR